MTDSIRDKRENPYNDTGKRESGCHSVRDDQVELVEVISVHGPCY